jgi:hypothetical protein
VAILLGNGDGTFRRSNPITLGTLNAVLAVGDFNGDGVPDLAAVNNVYATQAPNSTPSTVTIFLGNGDGTFTPVSSNPASAGQNYSDIVVADFNGDGKLDLAIADYAPNNPGNCDLVYGLLQCASTPTSTITILLGNGDGTFTQGTDSPLSIDWYALSIAVGDFNADDIPDLAVASACGYYPTSCNIPNAGPTLVTLLLGNGDGTFTQTTNSPVGLPGPTVIAVGDFNGDGISDFVTSQNSEWTGPDSPPKETALLSQLTKTAAATATCVSPMGLGSHHVYAAYVGGDNYKPSVSANVLLIAQQVTPVVTVLPGSTSLDPGQALSVTVTVSGGSGNLAATGTVTLTGGGYTSAALDLSGGVAIVNIPAGSLATGTDTLAVSYTPDAGSSSIFHSASGMASVTVTNANYSLSATALTVARGASGASTVNVNSTSGYVGDVTLACWATANFAGAVDLPTCSSNQTAALNLGTTSGAVIVTVNTTPAKNSALSLPIRRNGKGWICAVGSASLAVLLLWIPSRRRKRLSMLGVLIVLVIVNGLIGCGGHGASAPLTDTGTTLGAYTVIVSGTGSDPAKTAAITTFSLTVN